MAKNYFEGVIGQTKVKNKLGFRLDSLKNNGAVIPHALFVGSKGDGKSHIVRAFARNLPDPTDATKKHKTFYPLNGAAISSPKHLFEDIFAKTQGEHATFFIDEAHDLPDKVETVLLTVLEPNKGNKTRYTWDDVEYVFDFREVTFLFATTEPNKMFHALRDRLDIIPLAAYSQRELGDIIELNIADAVDFTKGLIMEMAGYVRQNGRSAARLAQDILATGASKFSPPDWEKLRKTLNIAPKGLSPDEIRVLQVLKRDGDMSLGMLSSRIARQRTEVQHDIEPYLLALGFMAIDGHREITKDGEKYLELLGKIS